MKRAGVSWPKTFSISSFEGSVAAAVKYQRFLTAQQARGVSAQGQIGSPLRRVLSKEFVGILIGPTIFHGAP